MNRSHSVLVLAPLLGLAGCYVAPAPTAPVTVTPIPPAVATPVPPAVVGTPGPCPLVPGPAQTDVQSLPPVSEQPLLWQPGHWDWNGTSYVWAPGTWVPRDGHGTVWQPGYWAMGNVGCAWVPGHWA